MRKLLLLFAAVFVCNISFGQSYDIIFDVIEKASPFLGKDWDFSFIPHTTMTVKFDGAWLKIDYKESGKNFLLSKVNSVKIADIYDRYDKSKLQEKNYILEVIEEGTHYYYIIKFEYVSKYSMLKSCHIPYMYKDGKIMSYTILQSNFISL